MKYYNPILWSPILRKFQDHYNALANDIVTARVISQSKDGHVISFREILNSRNSEMFQEFEQITGVKPWFVQIFSAGPGVVGMVHKDGIDRKCCINIPLRGCEEGINEWTLPEDGTTKLVSTEKLSIQVLSNPDQPVNIAEATLLTVPILFRTDEWHRLDNGKNVNYRHIASIRFVDNPAYDDVLKILTERSLCPK